MWDVWSGLSGCIARSMSVGAERYEIGVGPTGYILL